MQLMGTGYRPRFGEPVTLVVVLLHLARHALDALGLA